MKMIKIDNSEKYSGVAFHNIDYLMDISKIQYVNILSFYGWKWIYVQNRDRESWELPWWHCELWETIFESARRELFEETWSIDYSISQLWYWTLQMVSWEKVYGAVFLAKIKEIWVLPDSEIGKIDFFLHQPEILTYPEIQIPLCNYFLDWISLI
jgi:8-oxo-dGTP diphosphatase